MLKSIWMWSMICSWHPYACVYVAGCIIPFWIFFIIVLTGMSCVWYFLACTLINTITYLFVFRIRIYNQNIHNSCNWITQTKLRLIAWDICSFYCVLLTRKRKLHSEIWDRFFIQNLLCRFSRMKISNTIFQTLTVINMEMFVKYSLMHACKNWCANFSACCLFRMPLIRRCLK